MNTKDYFIYIMSNKTDTVLYVGVTNNLVRRVFEHKNHLVEGFTSKYNINKLVYFEQVNDVVSAIDREKQIKSWSRKRKEELILSINKDKVDLYDSLLQVENFEEIATHFSSALNDTKYGWTVSF